MRLKQPRIAPLPADGANDSSRILGGVANITQTFLNHPVAAKAWMSWGAYFLGDLNTLPMHQRELVILRTAFLCCAGYSWAHHSKIGLAANLTESEIARVKLGPDAPGWTELETALLRAADDLHREQFVTEPVWKVLSQYLTVHQHMDVVFSAAQYTSNAMILNSFGVQLDQGLALDPDLARFGKGQN
jgi:4-carboxymuconolactone decarboxylase